MQRPLIIGLGAALIAFGTFFFGIAVLAVGVIFGESGNFAALLALIVVAAGITTVGIGMFVYGLALPSRPTEQRQSGP
ncbi:MAG: hypothetical protein HY247_04565 [archaeon]|nr:MAG: hypothetical protein HY247_04565 [archaeon]